MLRQLRHPQKWWNSQKKEISSAFMIRSYVRRLFSFFSFFVGARKCVTTTRERDYVFLFSGRHCTTIWVGTHDDVVLNTESTVESRPNTISGGGWWVNKSGRNSYTKTLKQQKETLTRLQLSFHPQSFIALLIQWKFYDYILSFSPPSSCRCDVGLVATQQNVCVIHRQTNDRRTTWQWGVLSTISRRSRAVKCAEISSTHHT